MILIRIPLLQIMQKIVLESNPDGSTFERREANLANYKIGINDINTVEYGNSTEVEMEIKGIITGEIEAPDGSTISPTGITHFKVCMIIEWDLGRIKKQRIYSDFISFIAGFGLMPS